MNRHRIFWRFVPALAVFVMTGCAAQFESVDGEDAMYVDAPPANVEAYPRYEVTDGFVYNVNGRYYHQHGNRWVVYRGAPRAVRARGR